MLSKISRPATEKNAIVTLVESWEPSRAGNKCRKRVKYFACNLCLKLSIVLEFCDFVIYLTKLCVVTSMCD